MYHVWIVSEQGVLGVRIGGAVYYVRVQADKVCCTDAMGKSLCTHFVNHRYADVMTDYLSSQKSVMSALSKLHALAALSI